MHIAVFGAAGWLGRAILSNLEGRHTIRAVDRSQEAWQAWEDVDGTWDGGEIIHGDITDFASVESALDNVDAVIHTPVFNPGDRPLGEDAEAAFSINVRGLWNVLESARRHELRMVVHVGSCQSSHPQGVFFTADVRRPDASLYAVTKRLQEEMCRQFHEGHGTRIVVLRPDYIVDSRLGIGRHREKLEGSPPQGSGWVCRHDLAQACRLAVESNTIDFDIFHTVGETRCDATCDVARSRDALGLTYEGDLAQYRTG